MIKLSTGMGRVQLGQLTEYGAPESVNIFMKWEASVKPLMYVYHYHLRYVFILQKIVSSSYQVLVSASV